MTISLRLAGFEVRDVIEWLYFSGFPKSHNVGKAFDRRAGKLGVQSQGFSASGDDGRKAELKQDLKYRSDYGYQYEYKSELGRKYSGWGTALKPAHEPIIVVRKPLIDADTGRKLTVADCVEKYGTGAINIDSSRIATFGEDAEKHKAEWNRTQSAKQSDTATFLSPKEKEADLRAFAKDGRFPANCITLDSDEFYSKYFNVGQANVSQANISPEELSKKASKKDRNSDWKGEEIALEEKRAGGMQGTVDGSMLTGSGNERKTVYRNTHPTVKPIDIMAWLVDRKSTRLNSSHVAISYA